MKPAKLKRNFLRDFHKYAREMIVAEKAFDSLPDEVEDGDPLWEKTVELSVTAESRMEDFLGQWIADVTEHFILADYATLEELRQFFDDTVNNYAPFDRNNIDYCVYHDDFA